MQRSTLNSLVMPSCGDFDNMQSELNNAGSLGLVGNLSGSSIGVTVNDSNSDGCGLSMEADDGGQNNIIHINVGNYCQDSGAGIEIQKAIANLGGCLTANEIGQLAIGNFSIGGSDYLSSSGGIDLQSALANLGYTLADVGNGIEIHTSLDVGNSDLQSVINGLNCGLNAGTMSETLASNSMDVQNAINCYSLSGNESNISIDVKNASNCYTIQQSMPSQSQANNNMEIYIGGLAFQQSELQKAINNSLGFNVVQTQSNNNNNQNSIPCIGNFADQTCSTQQNLGLSQNLNSMGIQTYVLSNIGNQLCISNLGVQNCPTTTLRQSSNAVKPEPGANGLQVCNTAGLLQTNNLIGAGNQIINNNLIFQNGMNGFVQPGATLSNINLQNCLNTGLQSGTNFNSSMNLPPSYVMPKVELTTLDGVNLANLGQLGNVFIKNDGGALQNILNNSSGTNNGFVNIPQEILLGLTGAQVLHQNPSETISLQQLQQAAGFQSGNDSSAANLFLQQNQNMETVSKNNTPLTTTTTTTSGGSTCSVGPNGEKIFTCQHCSRQFNQSVSLNAHMRIHVGAKPFTCQQCQKQFSKFGNLKIHMRIHNGQKSFKCSQCHKTFVQNANLISQLKGTDRAPLCPQCDKKSSESEQMADGLSTNPGAQMNGTGETLRSAERSPDINGSKSPMNSTITSSVNSSVVNSNLRTAIINSLANGNSSLASVLQSHQHGEHNGVSPATISGILTANKPYVCPECNQQFTQNCNLIDHMKVHTVQKAFSCPQCSKQFTRNSSLTHHMRNHSGEKPFRCDHCGKQFTRNSSLTHHMKVHSDGKLFTCSHCGKQFARHISLNAHMRVHASHRPFHCLFCPKQFTRNSSLNHHLRSHSGDKPYECPECQKQFTQNSSLKDHLRLHTGERPFNCNHCNKQFSRNSSLVHHLKIHSGDKPYTCQHCGKKFAKNIGLNAHMRIHTAARPFSCPHCNKQFTQNSNLNVHMRIHNAAHSNSSITSANAASVVTAAAAAIASSLAASSRLNEQEEHNANTLPTTAQLLAASLPSARSLLAAVTQQRRQDASASNATLPQLSLTDDGEFTLSNQQSPSSIAAQVPNIHQVFASLSGSNSLQTPTTTLSDILQINSTSSLFTEAQKTALLNNLKLNLQATSNLHSSNFSHANGLSSIFDGIQVITSHDGNNLDGLDLNLASEDMKNSIFATSMSDISTTGQSFINLTNLTLDQNSLLNFTLASANENGLVNGVEDSPNSGNDIGILYATASDSHMDESMETSKNDNLLSEETLNDTQHIGVTQEMVRDANTPLTVMTDSQLINLGASNNFQNLVF